MPIPWYVPHQMGEKRHNTSTSHLGAGSTREHQKVPNPSKYLQSKYEYVGTNYFVAGCASNNPEPSEWQAISLLPG
jgi:hypothetical protein